MKITIDEWNNVGGFGILHRSSDYKKTIYELIELASPSNLADVAKKLPIVSRGLWNKK